MDVSFFPQLKTFQWSRPLAPNPRLASPISDTDITLLFTNPPLDENDNVIQEAFLMGLRRPNSYVETVLVPTGILNFDAEVSPFTNGDLITGVTSGATAVVALSSTGALSLYNVIGTFQNDEQITSNTGGDATVDGTLTPVMSTDGLTATGVIRGIELSGIDFTTSNPDLAVDHNQDSAAFCNISALLHQMMISALQGDIASGNINWLIGRDRDENITITAANGDANPPKWRFNASLDFWEFSNNGIDFTPFGTGAGVTAGDGIATIIGGLIEVALAATNSGLEFVSGELQIDHSEFQNSIFTYDSTDTGVADAYEIELTPTVTSLVEGLKVQFKAANTNTGPSTLEVDGLGAIDLKKRNDQDLSSGDIEAGQLVEAMYDGTTFQMMTPEANTPATEQFVTDLINIEAGLESFNPIAVSETKVFPHSLGRLPRCVSLQWGSQVSENAPEISVPLGWLFNNGGSTGDTHSITRVSNANGEAVFQTGGIVDGDNGAGFNWIFSLEYDETNITLTVTSFTTAKQIGFTWKAE